MKKSIQTVIKKVVDMPLKPIGLTLARTGPEVVHSMPDWQSRMQLAAKLGFQPKVILDGGAFKGKWTVEAHQIFPDAQIIIAEPNPFIQDSIKINISHIKPKPILIEAAIGEKAGSATFNMFKDSQSDTSASLLDNVGGDATTKVVVEIASVDEIAERLGLWPDLIKLDLQGAELQALRGAKKALKHAQMVMVEFGCLDAYVGRTTPQELMAELYKFSYCLYDIVDCHYRPFDNALTGGDFFFVKTDCVLRSHKGYE